MSSMHVAYCAGSLSNHPLTCFATRLAHEKDFVVWMIAYELSRRLLDGTE